MSDFVKVTNMPLFKDTCTKEPKCNGCTKNKKDYKNIQDMLDIRNISCSYIACRQSYKWRRKEDGR